jgi:hypothetical protein
MDLMKKPHFRSLEKNFLMVEKWKIVWYNDHAITEPDSGGIQ